MGRSLDRELLLVWLLLLLGLRLALLLLLLLLVRLLLRGGGVRRLGRLGCVSGVGGVGLLHRRRQELGLSLLEEELLLGREESGELMVGWKEKI